MWLFFYIWNSIIGGREGGALGLSQLLLINDYDFLQRKRMLLLFVQKTKHSSDESK